MTGLLTLFVGLCAATLVLAIYAAAAPARRPVTFYAALAGWTATVASGTALLIFGYVFGSMV